MDGARFLVVAVSGRAVLARTTRLGCLLICFGTWLPLLSPALIPDHRGAVWGWDVTAAVLALPQWVGLVLVGTALLRGSLRAVPSAAAGTAA